MTKMDLTRKFLVFAILFGLLLSSADAVKGKPFLIYVSSKWFSTSVDQPFYLWDSSSKVYFMPRFINQYFSTSVPRHTTSPNFLIIMKIVII